MAPSAKPYRVKTISEFHQLRGMPKPEHPLVSVVNLETLEPLHITEPQSLVLDYYSISIKYRIYMISYNNCNIMFSSDS